MGKPECVEIDREVYTAWCRIGSARELDSHTQIAAFLIHTYLSNRDAGNLSEKFCVHCSTPLSLLCLRCYVFQRHRQPSKVEPAHSVNNNNNNTTDHVSTDLITSTHLDGKPARKDVDDKTVSVQDRPQSQVESETARVDYASLIPDTDSPTSVLSSLQGEMGVSRRDSERTSNQAHFQNHGKNCGDKAALAAELSPALSPQSVHEFSDAEPDEHMPNHRESETDQNGSEEREGHTSAKNAVKEAKSYGSLQEADVTVKKLTGKLSEASVFEVDRESKSSHSDCGQPAKRSCRKSRSTLSHADPRPFSCEECGTGFTRKDHLKRHIRNKHPAMADAPTPSKEGKRFQTDGIQQEDDDSEIRKREPSDEANTTASIGADGLSCRECGQTFSSRSTLMRHIRIHTNDRRYSCRKCGGAFYRMTHLKMHIMRKHQSVRPFVCTLCSASFTDAYHLHRHENTHARDRPFQCTECKAAFSNTRQLKNHLQTHMTFDTDSGEQHQNIKDQSTGDAEPNPDSEEESTENLVSVQGSETQVTEPSSSAARSESVKSENSESLISSQGDLSNMESFSVSQNSIQSFCGKKEEVDSAWREYAVINSSVSSKRKGNLSARRVQKKNACSHPGCGAVFISPAKLKEHESSHTGERPYKCKHCGQGFTRAQAAKRHELLHMNIKPFVCKECGHAFARHSHLVKHARQHSGERPYVCSVCGSAFLDPSHLKRHYRKHTGEKPYMCEWCGSSFIQSGQLKTHIMAMHTHHRPFQCKLCLKAYTTSSLLTVHIRSHTGERPYVCSHCGAAFKIISHLKDHTLKHTGEKPKQCRLCPSAYTRTSHLKRHMERAHPGCDSQVATRSVSITKDTPPLAEFLNNFGDSLQGLKREGSAPGEVQ